MGWKDENSPIKTAKVLVVGAGGIGCELLKNLALTGFKNIHVVDLDTIDVSNLNRQFLFRREHVGQSKAKVASEAVKMFCPDIYVKYYHESIFVSQFNLSFFQTFALVINALDNKAARSHVNRMCLAAKVPLIESGSSGYTGQVTVIVRDLTECFECLEKPSNQKTYPGCTIRNTPSEHIHCTVWSKHVFNQLFGEIDIDDDVSPDMDDKDNKPEEEDTTENSQLKNGSLAISHTSNEEKPAPMNTRKWAEQVNYDPELIFNKLFDADIQTLISMTNLWKKRTTPVPIKFSDAIKHKGPKRNVADVLDDFNKVWSILECAQVFEDCVIKLRDRKNALPENEILTWDKDDEDAMAFVAACANIRATIFNIRTKSLFEIKSMAGNIIPAIATTNAIVAGMVIPEAIRLINGQAHSCLNTFNRALPNPRGKVLVDEKPSKPNPQCYVCSAKRECFVVLNPDEMTVKSLKEKVLKKDLSMLAPDVMDITTSRVIISSEDGDTDDLECKTLSELSIGDGAMLACDDFQQDLEMKVILVSSADKYGDDFEIIRSDVEVNNRKRKQDEGNGDIIESVEKKKMKI